MEKSHYVLLCVPWNGKSPIMCDLSHIPLQQHESAISIHISLPFQASLLPENTYSQYVQGAEGEHGQRTKSAGDIWTKWKSV